MNINNNLAEVVKLYATASHIELNTELLKMSKDSIIALFNDLLTIYINDKNSSTVREFVTVSISGYNHSSDKIGYNGYRHATQIGGKSASCEAKPKNIDTLELERYKKKERKSKPSLLNGGGNFTDYTWARFEKDIQNNPNLLISGFIDGRLIYIFEFPFNSHDFTLNLKSKLQRKFPSGDIKNSYLRSADFDYKNFINEKSIKINFLISKSELLTYKSYINSKFFQWILTQTK